MRKITLLLLSLTISSSTIAQEFGKLTFNKAVNISGKQRMLGQKMGKIYLYLLENPEDENAKRDLQTTKVIFEKQNEILYSNAVSIQTKRKVEDVNSLWGKLGPLFEKKPNISDAKKILADNSKLLRSSDAVVQSIILDAETNSQHLSDNTLDDNIDLKKVINLSGKQRMLAQRLALYYYANNSSLKSTANMNDLRGTYMSFDNAISDLLISNFNNDKSEQVLGEAMRDWELFKEHKSDFLSHKMSNEDVYKKTNNLTKTFNKLTILYEKVKLDD